MKACLEIFNKNLDGIRNYIKSLKLESDLLSISISKSRLRQTEKKVQELNSLINNTRLDKRRYNYITIIISLYGCFERYMEFLLESYILELSKTVPSYSDLPKAILENHINLSINLINRQEKNDFGYTEKKRIIKNLHCCLDNHKNFEIDAESFSTHTANFRTTVIDSYFSKIGINSISKQIICNSVFRAWLKNDDPDRNINNIKTEIAFKILDDTSERRNEIAHGSISNTLSLEYLDDYCIFFKSYGEAIHNIVLNQYRSFKRYDSYKLGKPIKIYNNKIVCFAVDQAIKKGDLLFAETGDKLNKYLSGEIVDIQINQQSVDEITPIKKENVGLKICFKVKENYTFFLMKRV